MEDTKALSPEAKGLFETIKKQAKQYADAFGTLERETAELSSLKEEVSRLTGILNEDVSSSLKDIQDTVNDSIAVLETRTNKTQRIYSELEDIVDLKNELQELRDTLKKLQVELDSSISTFQKKSDIELDSIIESSKARITKEIENEISKVEVKLALKLRQMESKFQTYDKKLYAFMHSFGKEEKDLAKDLESLRKKFTEIRGKTEELQNNMEEKIDLFDKDISKKVELIESMIASFEQKYKDKFDDDYSRYTPEDNAKEIKTLKELNSQLGASLKDLEKKKNTAMLLAVISAVGVLIIAVVTFM